MSRQQKHLFIIDPLEKLDKNLDTSMKLMHALAQKSCAIFFTTMDQVYWESSKPVASCLATGIEFDGANLHTTKSNPMSLKDFYIIHMRKDPPFDMNYIACTWLLESASQTTHVINSTWGLRKYNEKVATLYFPEYSLPTIVSSNPEYLMGFLKDTCNGDAVLKPLDLYGGRGVERVNLSSAKEAELMAKFKEQTANYNWRMMQPFQSQIKEGEVRVFTSFAEPIAWCLKVPKEGEFLANTRAGAKLLPHTPTVAELTMVKLVSKKLMDDGIYWVGFDLIGGKISEINITSPRLLCPDPKDYGPCFDKMAQQIIRI